jgi:N-acetylmuramoyl-L-alanine amidase
MSKFHWAIDMGHGPRQAGKRSPLFPEPLEGRRFFEWRFNREVAIGIVAALKERGIRCSLIADSLEEKLGSALKLRVDRFNSLPVPEQERILLSIHANAFGDGKEWTSPNGVEVWYKEGAGDMVRQMAQSFQDSLVRHTALKDRGVKQTTSFYLHRHAKGAAVILTENGFYTNLPEALLMLTPQFKKKVIDAHVEVIEKLEQL